MWISDGQRRRGRAAASSGHERWWTRRSEVENRRISKKQRLSTDQVRARGVVAGSDKLCFGASESRVFFTHSPPSTSQSHRQHPELIYAAGDIPFHGHEVLRIHNT